MALSNFTFITLAQVKAQIDESATTWDTPLELMIEACTRFAMNYCARNRFIAPTSDETEYYDGGEGGNKKLFLRSFPIKSITSISYRSGGTYATPTYTAFSADTEFIQDAQKGIVSFAALPPGVQNIKVVYKGGYDTEANVPADLKMAVIQAVVSVWNKRKSEGMTNESIGGGSISWDKEKSFLAILDSYKMFL